MDPVCKFTHIFQTNKTVPQTPFSILLILTVCLGNGPIWTPAGAAHVYSGYWKFHWTRHHHLPDCHIGALWECKYLSFHQARSCFCALFKAALIPHLPTNTTKSLALTAGPEQCGLLSLWLHHKPLIVASDSPSTTFCRSQFTLIHSHALQPLTCLCSDLNFCFSFYSWGEPVFPSKLLGGALLGETFPRSPQATHVGVHAQWMYAHTNTNMRAWHVYTRVH